MTPQISLSSVSSTSGELLLAIRRREVVPVTTLTQDLCCDGTFHHGQHGSPNTAFASTVYGDDVSVTYPSVPKAIPFYAPPKCRCRMAHDPCHRVDLIFKIVSGWRRKTCADWCADNSNRLGRYVDGVINWVNWHENPKCSLSVLSLRFTYPMSSSGRSPHEFFVHSRNDAGPHSVSMARSRRSSRPMQKLGV